MKIETGFLDRQAIEDILPHRRPFLFLEDAKILEPGVKGIGRLTDLSHPDFAFLAGHFPVFRVVPGVIITETLAELLGVVASSGGNESNNKIGILVEDKMRYRQMVRPGDLINLEAEVTNIRRDVVWGKVQALKDGKVAAGGEITFAMIDKP